MRQKVIKVDFGNKKKKKLWLWCIVPVILAVPAILIWWFVHVNTQGGLTSLYPTEIKNAIASSKSITVIYKDGSKDKIEIDKDKFDEINESLWEQTALENGLKAEYDLKFYIKSGSSKCEIRLMDDENIIVGVLNNYFRSFEMPEEEFQKLYSIFKK